MAVAALQDKGIAGGFLDARVGHTRHAPKHHALSYGVWYLCLDIDDLSQLDKFHLISRNRFNLFSINDADYGLDKGQSIGDWVAQLRHDYNLPEGRVTLVTMASLLGYGFNPVSFWFFTDPAGELRAVLAEVNNTFGERHCYLCRHTDGAPILPTDWLHHDKIFHVSPFMKVSGTYDFRFKFTAAEVAVWINYNDQVGGQEDGLPQRMLSTYVAGRRQPLNDLKLITAAIRYPLVTLKVVAMIHWHAVRLLLKGIRYNAKPKPPTRMVSQ